MILHEGPQARCMTLFLPDEQFNYPKQVRDLLLPRETFCRSQERPPLGLFTELKRCDGACNELPFIGPQNIGEAVMSTSRMQGVLFEMIQPDLELSSTHAATLLFTQHRVCEPNPAAEWRNSGGLWRRLRSAATVEYRAAVSL
jgi:hypothetical protein